jgi:D-alanyl-D-alanine carboxypeptidase
MRRVLVGGILALFLVATVDLGDAATPRRRAVHHKRARSIRAVSLHRDRSLHVQRPVESLELPRAGVLGDLPRPDALARHAAAAVLMNANTGEVLFARNPDEELPPASITKILTALVILEEGNLSDPVVVSQTAAQVGGFRLGLRLGQRLSLGDLLAAILIRSANDAAEAAAEHVGPGLAGFVARMNAKAQALGMHRSHFANPHGLDEPGHYTTARDMAILTRVALENPTFADLVRTRETRVTIYRPSRKGAVPAPRMILTHNRLLGHVEGVDGVKTGYTGLAGQCLVASASRRGRRMIAVLLNDPERWTDAPALLHYGFELSGSAVHLHSPEHLGPPVPSEGTRG